MKSLWVLVAVVPMHLLAQSDVPRPFNRPGLVYDAARNVTVLFGGYADGTRVDETWEWDGSEWTRRDLVGPPARFTHGMVYDARRERVVLFGGWGNDDVTFGDTWEYDGRAWTKVADTGPAPRGAFGMAYDAARGRTVLYGGDAGSAPATDTWEWDGVRWTQVATTGPSGNTFHSLAYDERRARIVAFGGRGGGDDTWEWDGRAWTKVSDSGPPPRDHHALTYDSRRGRVVLTGGTRQQTSDVSVQRLRDLWAWDGSRWERLDSVGSPWAGGLPGFTYDRARDRLVLFGSGDAHGTWEWDGAAWGYADPVGATSHAPAGRAGHVMTTAGSSGVLLFAGQLDDQPRLADTLWHWNGAVWRMLDTNGPHNRTLPAAAYDSRRGRLVLYGGIAPESGTRFGDTWEYGFSWTERNVRTPGARDHHAMAYDAARGVSVMYGGQDADRRFRNDTWTWNGEVWTMVDSLTGPGGVGHHGMAYDERRERVVRVGGSGPNGARGTWEWDGVRWEQRATDGPTQHTRIAYDAVRGVMVVLDRQSVTWTWDGVRWQRLDVPGPTTRVVHAMAYDARSRRIVLFGGSGPGGSPPYSALRDVWEWDGSSWTKVR